MGNLRDRPAAIQERPFVMPATSLAPPLVVTRQVFVLERLGDVDRLLDRIRDALGGAGVLEVPGVADQHPPWTVTATEETTHHGLRNHDQVRDPPRVRD